HRAKRPVFARPLHIRNKDAGGSGSGFLDRDGGLCIGRLQARQSASPYAEHRASLAGFEGCLALLPIAFGTIMFGKDLKAARCSSSTSFLPAPAAATHWSWLWSRASMSAASPSISRSLG